MVLSEKHINKLESIVGKDRCKTTTAELYAYAFDASIHRRMPDVVVRPLKAEEISDILKFANEEKIPVVPRGAGTALCGHAVPIDGGILLDMQGMKKIIEVKPNDFYCVVEPGVVCDDLNDELAKYNFFIPGPASSEAATIGGMVAANASGSNAL
jgi:glycolate oxidase